MSMDTDLAGTPYQQKFSDYLSSGEAETFTYTIRRSGNKYYIGVDGTEYCCIELGGARKPSSATENLAGTISENLKGTRVGLRSKSTNVYYSNIAITPVEEVSITYDAVNGRIGEEQIVNKTYAYGGTIGTLPVPVYDGYEFTGWYYTDYATGEVVQLTEDKALDSSIWKLTVTARYRKEGAEPFTVVFDTGVDGYTVPSVEGWLEGNPLEAPKLSKDCFAMPQYTTEIIEQSGDNPQHVGILNNFANAILGLEPLYVDGREGLKCVELINAMQLSSWLNKEVALPNEDELYWTELQKRISTSRIKICEDLLIDNSSSFGGTK